MTDYYYIKPIFMSSISLHDQLIQFNSIRYIKQNLTKVYLVSMSWEPVIKLILK